MKAATLTSLGIGHFLGMVTQDQGFDPKLAFLVVFVDRSINVVQLHWVSLGQILMLTNEVDC